MTALIVTQPTSELVTLAEAKAHLRVEESFDDVLIQNQIKAARQYIEKVCCRGLLFQTWAYEAASFAGADKFELEGSGIPAEPQPLMLSSNRRQPFIELSTGHLAETPGVAITYYDTNNVQQTLSPSAYLIHARGENYASRIYLNVSAGYSWPDVYYRPDAVRVQFNVGWSSVTKVPAPIKQSCLLLVSQMYEYRTPQVTGTIVSTMQFTIDALLEPYRFGGHL